MTADNMQATEAQSVPTQRLLRIREAAKITGLSVSYLYALCERSELAYHKFGRSRRIALSDLEEFISKNRVAA